MTDTARRVFHPRTHRAVRTGGTLGLREAVAMAVGGMFGGGIFPRALCAR